MHPGTMKEAHVHSDTTVTIHDAPIPEITHPSQILVKVIVSGTNPKVSQQSALAASLLLTHHANRTGRCLPAC